MLKEHVGSIDFKVKGSVLILVLMEHAQRGDGQDWRTCHQRQDVLILILMEHAQRVYETNVLPSRFDSLNPYFNGTCSKRRFRFGRMV